MIPRRIRKWIETASDQRKDLQLIVVEGRVKRANTGNITEVGIHVWEIGIMV